MTGSNVLIVISVLVADTKMNRDRKKLNLPVHCKEYFAVKTNGQNRVKSASLLSHYNIKLLVISYRLYLIIYSLKL